MDHQSCPPPEVLRAFAMGDLPEDELGRLVGHLESCPDCERQVARLDGLADTMLVDLRHRLPASSGLPTSPVDAAPPDGQDPTEPAATLPANLDGFRIIRELGRGGMGVVYEAYQGSLNRHVAIKMLPERGDLARFHREARAAGRLHHTNIVPVFGISEQGGRHFYIMQFIAGRGLDTFIKEGGRGESIAGGAPAGCDPRVAVRIGVQAAEALAYAHAQGVIHRDVKPSNILLDKRGVAWVADFGLAHDATDTATLTHTGDLLGTLRYMAPERISGRGDERADVYGLGASLYELICGRPAFAEADRAALLNQVLHHDPPRPRLIDPDVPRDLETVVLKAMARDPARRYASAADMAEDLRRYLDDRPIRARRAGPWERAVRWSRRNPTIAGLLATLVAVFLVGFAAVTVQWRRANAEALRANQTAHSEAEARAAESALRIRAQAEIAGRDFEKGLELARRGDTDLGSLWMAEALRPAPAERPEFARMARANLAAWGAQQPRLRTILEHQGAVSKALFRPDGRAILTGSSDGTARLWDPATGVPIGPPLVHNDMVFCIAFSPDGRRVVTGGFDGRVRLWDPTTGRSVGPVLIHGEPVWSLASSPDGRLLATHGRDYAVRLWDLESGRPVGPPIATGLASDVHFSPDGRLLLVGGQDGITRLWDVAAGRLAGSTLQGTRVFSRFSPDGRLIATTGEDGTAQLWDAATRRLVRPLLRHGASLGGAAFSPDGRLVLTFDSDGMARIHDVATGRPVGLPLRHGDEIKQAAFSPDGRLVLTASQDHTARLWDAASGRLVGAPLRHRLGVSMASFSPDGRLVLTAGGDGMAKIWELGGEGEVPLSGEPARGPGGSDSTVTAPGAGSGFSMATFSPDRSRALLGGDHGLARVVDTATGQPVGAPLRHRWATVNAVAYSPDGRRVATASRDVGFNAGGSMAATCQIWDAATGRPASPLLPHVNWIGAMTFRPDGKVLGTGDYSGFITLWDVDSGAMIGNPVPVGSIVVALAFSPDGRTVAAGTTGTAYQAVLWDPGSGRPPGPPIRFQGWVNLLAFSPDGIRLGAGSHDATARLIDVATGRVIDEPLPHANKVRGMAFGPDGRLLLTVTAEGRGTSAARLWDAATGRPASPAMAHPRPIVEGALAFSPDGTKFATGCVDGSVHLWDVATARAIGPPLRLRGRALGVAFGLDGRSLLAVDAHGDVHAWPVPEPSGDPVDRLIGRLQARNGIEIDSAGEIAILGPDAWRRRRAEAGDSPSTPDPGDDPAWHEACARDAEVVGNIYAARWHLDRLIAARPGDGLAHARRACVPLRDGDGQAAGADLDRALTLGPRDRILDWLLNRAEDLLADGRHADALRLLDPVVAARPGDWMAHALRADVYGAIGRSDDREAGRARAVERGAEIPYLIGLAAEYGKHGRWSDAVGLYDRAIARGTVPYEVWTQAAIAHLETGDESGYRRVCETLRSRHPAAIAQYLVRKRLAGVCTLGPGGVGDDGKAQAWTEASLKAIPATLKHRRHTCLTTLGAILCRSGRFREAIGRINEGIALEDGAASPEDLAFLAIANFHAGDDAEGRRILARLGTEELEGPPSAYWDIRTLRLHRDEAIRSGLDHSFPADPFAH